MTPAYTSGYHCDLLTQPCVHMWPCECGNWNLYIPELWWPIVWHVFKKQRNCSWECVSVHIYCGILCCQSLLSCFMLHFPPVTSNKRGFLVKNKTVWLLLWWTINFLVFFIQTHCCYYSWRQTSCLEDFSWERLSRQRVFRPNTGEYSMWEWLKSLLRAAVLTFIYIKGAMFHYNSVQ